METDPELLETMSDDPRRASIKARLAAAEARDAARNAAGKAGEAKDKFVAFAQEHPLATVAGGLALGVLVASLFPGPRRAARAGGARAAGLAAIGGEMLLALATQALSKAGEAGETARRAGHEAGDRLSEVGGEVVRGIARGIRKK